MEQALGQAYRLVLTAARTAASLAHKGEWTALLGLALAVYLSLYAVARMARTVLWTVKWATIVFAVLAAVGWADSGWKGQAPAGLRGVDWWSAQGAKSVPNGAGVPVWESVLGAKPKGREESTVQWANLARRASAAYAQHGFQTVYDLANQGWASLAEVAQDPAKAGGTTTTKRKRKR